MTDTEPLDAAPEPGPEPDPLSPDPTAPYGRTADGVLLDRKGRRAPHGLSKGGLRKDHAPHAADRMRKRRDGSRPAGRTITAKRRQGLLQLAELPKGVLLGVGWQADNEAMLADAVTLDMHAPPLADAIAQLAEDNDRLGAVVDRIIEVGPLAQIGMVVGAFLAQLARNHNAVPAPVAALLGGTHDPAELAQVARGTMEQATQNGAEPQPAAA